MSPEASVSFYTLLVFYIQILGDKKNKRRKILVSRFIVARAKVSQTEGFLPFCFHIKNLGSEIYK